jgi:flagellar export protein FliJ
LSDALERREKLGIEAIGIDAFQLEQNFIFGTKQRIVQQDQALVRASRGVEKALRAYLHARRQTRTIEMLREKQYQEFRKALTKKEQKELDELSVMRARLREKEDSMDVGEQTA